MTTSPSSVESVVSMPVLNPATGHPSKTFRFFGVIDEHDSSRIIDYKSTSDPARFIHQQCIGLQPELYALALLARGITITEIEYRLVRTPTIKFIVPTYKWAVKKIDRKMALRVFDTEEEAQKLAKLQGASVEKRVKGDDGRDAYEARCLEWLADDSSKIVSHPHLVTEARLDQARHLLWESTKRILDNRKTGRWMANQHACFTYNRDCEYLDLCDCEMNGGDVHWLIEDQYERAYDCHPELGGAKCDKEILTFSSMGKLTLCEVYYLRRYEDMLRRRRSDDTEALWLGSAMHRGLEAHSKGGPVEAFAAIDTWADATPIIGPDQAHFQDQQIAKARAMVRAAAMKWPRTKGG